MKDRLWQWLNQGFEKHAGIIFAIIAILISFLLFASDGLRSLDDFLTALVYQMGYQSPPTCQQIVIIKKDEKTSSLLGQNPGRQEFASIFRLIGKARQQRVVIGGTDPVRSFKFLEIKLGSFKAGKEGSFSGLLFKPYWGAEEPDQGTFLKVSEKINRVFSDLLELPEDWQNIFNSLSGSASTRLSPEFSQKMDLFFKNLLQISWSHIRIIWL